MLQEQLYLETSGRTSAYHAVGLQVFPEPGIFSENSLYLSISLSLSLSNSELVNLSVQEADAAQPAVGRSTRVHERSSATCRKRLFIRFGEAGFGFHL